MKCALCGHSDTFETISTIDAKTSERLIVSLCSQCGLVQQTPSPSSHELKLYYSHHYRQDYKKTYIPKSNHIYRAGKIALQRIGFLKNIGITQGTLLDVGAGGGEFVYLSGKSGFQSQGIEPNIGYSEYANQEYGCEVMTGELDEIQGRYDVITSFHVLEHLPSPLAAFAKLYSLLNEKGILFIEVPWSEAQDASPINIYFKAHIFYFSVDTLTACASQFFNVKQVDTSSNLKIVFEARSEPLSLVLPSKDSIKASKERLLSKSWFEYLFKGNGFAKPMMKMMRTLEESKVEGKSPKSILDELLTRFD